MTMGILGKSKEDKTLELLVDALNGVNKRLESIEVTLKSNQNALLDLIYISNVVVDAIDMFLLEKNGNEKSNQSDNVNLFKLSFNNNDNKKSN